ncbi:MAG: hypothetical protein LH650_04130 [Chloroflexi bacterium]|nr:hypothetical protein [Chloroflexota bacterium]
MIHRLAILIGSIAAAAVLALGFAATGFGPAAAPADAEQPTAGAASAAIPDAATIKPITRVETTTVYVRPAAKPMVIHITKRTPAVTPRHTKVVHQTRSTTRERENESEHEGEGQDD